MAVQYRQSLFTGRDFYLRVTVEDLQQDIAGNRTQVRKTLSIVRQAGESRNPSGIGAPYSYSVNGTNVSSNANYNLAGESELMIHTATQWVTHDTDGTKSVAVVASMTANAGGQVMGTASVSGSIDLPRIPRGPRVKVSGAWKPSIVWVKVGGTWKVAIPYIKVGGSWKVGS